MESEEEKRREAIEKAMKKRERAILGWPARKFLNLLLKSRERT
jgi:hypothetical protein